jgi:hypothetical protein
LANAADSLAAVIALAFAIFNVDADLFLRFL